MYEFVRGPMAWISFALFIGGMAFQIFRLIKITSVKEKFAFSSEEDKEGFISRLKNFMAARFSSSRINNTILGTQPVIAIVSFIFHVCIIITPLFLLGHNILLFESWGFSLGSFSETTADAMTIVFLICAAVLLARRIFVRRVRAVSTFYDYLLLLITICPFLTGYLAYHQLVHYETIITIHILMGELMLIAVGLTKLGHMVFFFFVRFRIGSEYSFSGGSRKW